ncbi:uncharacterized protein LOC122509741 [Leptopilina heterotoma]|uniref:uncharacterized protein LOC122509741 n=1 Tax=Leptopilina heterotoma TaxID=63436 RepID=UPI001CA912D8|nr:uncharacterized protein LOC122509741 [Leptopilina heterotoma]
MYHKQKEYLRQIAKASEAIRRKHRMFKMGKENVENALNETFKPIVQPLEKIVNMSDIKRENVKTEKKEKLEFKEEQDDDSMSFMSADDSQSSSSSLIPGFEYDRVLSKYMYLVNHNRKQCLDLVYGVRKVRDGSLVIGDSPISFKDHIVNVGNKNFNITSGLLELLFKSKPENSYISEDNMNNYKQILITSNAHRKKYSSSEPVQTSRGYKFTNIISKLFPHNETPKRQSKTGSSLPKFMITKRNFQPDYVYWDDPNELVDRLRLLTASQTAGNPSHNNEIMSIIKELREAQIIY